MKYLALVLCLAGLSPLLRADGIPTGTWVMRPNKNNTVSTMIVETAGTGQKFTFNVKVAGGGTATMVVTTQGDGKDAVVFVDGKPSDETMAIHKIDDRHFINVIKMDGKPMASQKSEVSADGKVIKVDGTPTAAGAQPTVEYWDKK